MRHRRRQPISNINVVPYLDVMLVLLVIFMITTPLFNQGVVDIPSVGKEPLPTAEHAKLEVVYEETAKNPYRLIDHKESTETSQLNIAELRAELGKKTVLYDKAETTIIISADKALTYEKVMKLLGELRDEGYKLALSAQTENK